MEPVVLVQAGVLLLLSSYSQAQAEEATPVWDILPLKRVETRELQEFHDASLSFCLDVGIFCICSNPSGQCMTCNQYQNHWMETHYSRSQVLRRYVQSSPRKGGECKTTNNTTPHLKDNLLNWRVIKSGHLYPSSSSSCHFWVVAINYTNSFCNIKGSSLLKVQIKVLNDLINFQIIFKY